MNQNKSTINVKSDGNCAGVTKKHEQCNKKVSKNPLHVSKPDSNGNVWATCWQHAGIIINSSNLLSSKNISSQSSVPIYPLFFDSNDSKNIKEDIKSIDITSLNIYDMVSSIDDKYTDLFHEIYKINTNIDDKILWNPIKLRFKNIFVYGNDNINEINLKDGINLISSKQNCGKTSIINMITFCIYDSNAFSNNIISHNKTEGWIELYINTINSNNTINNSNSIYCIKKKCVISDNCTKVSTTLELVSDINNNTFINISESSENDTNRKILKMFNGDSVNSKNFASLKENLLILSPSDRLQYFNNICNIPSINNFFEEINRMCKEISNTINSNNDEIYKLSLTSGIKEETINTEVKLVEEYENIKSNNNETLIKLIERRTEILANIKVLNSVKLDNNDLSFEQLKSSIDTLNTQLKTFERSIIIESRGYKDIKVLQEMIHNLKAELSVNISDIEDYLKGEKNVINTSDQLDNSINNYDDETDIENDEDIDVLNTEKDLIIDLIGKISDLKIINEYKQQEIQKEQNKEKDKEEENKFSYNDLNDINNTIDELQKLKYYFLRSEDMLKHIFNILKSSSNRDTIREILDLENYDYKRYNELHKSLYKYYNKLDNELKYVTKLISSQLRIKSSKGSKNSNIHVFNKFNITEDDLEIYNSIIKYNKIISYININNKLKEYQEYIKNYDDKNKLLSIKNELDDINRQIEKIESDIRLINIKCMLCNQKIGCLKQKLETYNSSMEKSKKLKLINDDLEIKYNYYNNCSKSLSDLPKKILYKKVKQFEQLYNKIIPVNFSYKLKAEVIINNDKFTGINMNIVKYNDNDNVKSLILYHPSESELFLIKLIFDIVSNLLNKSRNFIIIDNNISYEQVQFKYIINIVKEYYEHVIICTSNILDVDNNYNVINVINENNISKIKSY